MKLCEQVWPGTFQETVHTRTDTHAHAHTFLCGRVSLKLLSASVSHFAALTRLAFHFFFISFSFFFLKFSKSTSCSSTAGTLTQPHFTAAIIQTSSPPNPTRPHHTHPTNLSKADVGTLQFLAAHKRLNYVPLQCGLFCPSPSSVSLPSSSVPPPRHSRRQGPHLEIHRRAAGEGGRVKA